VVVVGTILVAYTLVRRSKRALARRVRERDRLPDLCRHEYLNALSTDARYGGVSAEQADTIWQEAVAVFADCELPVDVRKALRVPIQFGVSAYDARYIVPPQSLGVRCVTEDLWPARVYPDLTTSRATFCSS